MSADTTNVRPEIRLKSLASKVFILIVPDLRYWGDIVRTDSKEESHTTLTVRKRYARTVKAGPYEYWLGG